jgi:hypothetical protein
MAAKKAAPKKKGRYVIVRTYSAGVFAGNLVSRKGREAVLSDARRLWYWKGAATLSQMAVSGTADPAGCKFPVAVPRVELTECIEVLDVTAAAEKSIKAVPVWHQN